ATEQTRPRRPAAPAAARARGCLSHHLVIRRRRFPAPCPGGRAGTTISRRGPGSPGGPGATRRPANLPGACPVPPSKSALLHGRTLSAVAGSDAASLSGAVVRRAGRTAEPRPVGACPLSLRRCFDVCVHTVARLCLVVGGPSRRLRPPGVRGPAPRPRRPGQG